MTTQFAFQAQRSMTNKLYRPLISARRAAVALAASGLVALGANQTAMAAATQAARYQLRLYTGAELVISTSASGAPPVLFMKSTGSGEAIPVAGQLRVRSDFAATVLPDGAVLISGGRDAAGAETKTLDEVEPTGAIRSLATSLQTSRASHSATLLTDGRVVLVGGTDHDRVLGTIEYFDAVTGEVAVSHANLLTPRSGHTATLLASGNILIRGGYDSSGAAITQDELFDPKAETVVAYNEALRQENEVLFDANSPKVVEIIPPHESRDVGVDEYVGLRFSRPPQIGTVGKETLTLLGPSGQVPSSVVPAQDGMLAFVVPNQDLLPGSRYTLFVQGLLDAKGASFPFTVSSFNTAKAVAAPPPITPDPVVGSINLLDDPTYVHPLANLRWPTPVAVADSEVWTPNTEGIVNGHWTSNKALAKSATQLPKAPDGITALSGQVLRLDGRPLEGVTLKVGDITTTTDENGAFLLQGVPSGPVVMDVNGASADHADTRYGRFLVRVQSVQGATVQLPFTVWMPKLDPRGTLKISSPTTEEVIVTTPAIPGLEVHIPAGTVIRDLDGKIVTEINLTAIPIDQPPFPLPGLNIPVFFTVQPGGAWIQSVDVQAQKGAQIYYPNYHKSLPKSRASFYDYDPFARDWFIYGQGQTSDDGKHVVPDAGVAVYQFTGAMFDSSPPAPPGGPAPGNGPGPQPNPPGPPSSPNGPSGDPPVAPTSPADPSKDPGDPRPKGCNSGCPNADSSGDPVSVSTGFFTQSETDLVVGDVIPLVLTRTYRSQDVSQRTFGIGWVSVYDTMLYSQNQWQEVDVILPDGGRAHFVRTSPGTDYSTAVFGSTTPGRWYGAQVFRNNPRSGWDLVFRDGTKWFFPQFAPIKEIVDPNGNTVTITRRDSNGTSGPLTRVESPNGRNVNFTLDSSGRVTQATDNMGRSYTYTYDASGRLWKVVDPLSGEHDYTYDSSNRLLTATDSRGITRVTNVYDANGRVTKSTLADGNYFTFAYTLSGSAVTQTDVTDQRGKVRHVEFNSAGYITRSIAAYGTPDAQQTLFALDTNGQILSVTDALGRVTKMTYDGFGNPATVTALYGTASAVTTTLTYTPDGAHLASVTDPLGHTVSYGHDAVGNLTTATDALGHVTTFGRDSEGRLTSLTDALSHVWTYAYTGSDLTSAMDPLGRTVFWAKDAVGRTTAMKDPVGNVSAIDFDARNRITKITDPQSATMVMGYDANGNLTNFTDQDGNTTTFTYNNLSARSGKTDALTHSETYAYGANGLLSQVTDRKGQISGITFDNLNRVSQRGYGASVANPTTFASTVTYTYDAGDRATQIMDSVGGTITRTYDGLDRLTQEQTPEGIIAYTYDNAGRRATMTVTGQPSVTYTYDNANRLVQIAKGTDTTIFAYDNANRRTSTTLPNGVVMAYGYDNANQLTSITYTAGSTAIGNLSYTYDLAGRRTSMGGSLATMNLPAAVSLATLNANNQLTGWAGSTFTYDLNGNLTSDGTNNYVWDERDRLTQITGGATASFLYDVFGRRRSKTIGTSQTGFLYDGMNFVQELSGTTATANIAAGGVDELFGRTDGAGTYYPITDALGSVIGLTDGVGNLQTQYSYEPYGKVSLTGSSSASSQKYTGREDDGTGLYFYRNRYYHPALGRFISEDPIGIIGGINLYAYVDNNPISYSDPFGLVKPSPQAALEAAISRGDVEAVKMLIESGEVSGPAAQSALRGAELAGKATGETGELAQALNRSQKAVKNAIEQCKQNGLPKGGPKSNPDVRVDPTTGDVYPEINGGKGGLGDSIGNIWDYLQ
jgi:RHS repeat-associated protein